MNTAIKQLTHIGTIRKTVLSNQERVCQLLDCTHEEYCWHQYECYEKFISLACADHYHAKQTFRYSPVFRGWFNDEWNKRNTVDFLPFAIDLSEDLIDDDGFCLMSGLPSGDDQLVNEYRFLHNPERLIKHDNDFQHSYSNIVGLIFKTIRL